MDNILYHLGAYCIASLTTALLCLIEIENYFKERRVTIWQILSHIPSVVFVLANGIAGALIFTWGGGYLPLGTDGVTSAPLKTLLNLESQYAVALAVAFMTPLIIRSRFLEVGTGDKKIDVGFDQIYGWAKRKVFAELGRTSGLKKTTASTLLARRYCKAGHQVQVFENLNTYVTTFLSDVNSIDLQQKYESDLSQLDAFYGNDRISEDYRQSVIKLAMDNVGLKAVQQHFSAIPSTNS